MVYYGTMNNTLANIQASAEAEVITFIDDSTPAGHFTAHTIILGIHTSYVLAGALDAPDAPIVGRVEIHGKGNTAYRGNGLKGGEFAGANKLYEDHNSAIVR